MDILLAHGYDVHVSSVLQKLNNELKMAA